MTKYTQFMKKHLLDGLSMKQAAAKWQKHKKSASPKRSGAKRSAKRSVAKRSGAKRSANKNIDLLKQVLRSVSPARKQKKQSLNAIVKKLLKATSPKKRSAKKSSAKKRNASSKSFDARRLAIAKQFNPFGSPAAKAASGSESESESEFEL